MKFVILKVKEHRLHISKLADEIFELEQYLQKKGNKAQYT